MGSLTSRPRISTGANVALQTPTYYTPVPTTPTGSTPAEDTAAREVLAGEQRAASAATLLRRERGRFGTILTSFRGLLGTNDGGQNTTRKTLLGE